jgi:hypothetical protein
LWQNTKNHLLEVDQLSCGSVKHRFEEQAKNGINFQKALEFYQDVEGSVAAHRMELTELQKNNAPASDINHLNEHIKEGESLLQKIKTMSLH